MSFFDLVEPSCLERSEIVMPVKTGIQVTDSVRHTVGKRYPGYGLDPGFHRGDEVAWIPGFHRNDGKSQTAVNKFRTPAAPN
jgi:hypothetical protein